MEANLGVQPHAKSQALPLEDYNELDVQFG